MSVETVAKRRALGRGLGALIPGAFPNNEEVAFEGSQRDDPARTSVPLAAIRPSRVQPRATFAEEAIAELVESIRQKGILQPLLVRPVDGGFELIAGERRLRAAQRLGLEEIPVSIRRADDREALELALIENIQRENLNPIEEAGAYRRLGEEFHLTHEEIARRVGKDRSTIANAVRLLQLPDAIKAKIEAGLLSAGHARTLIGLPSDAVRLDVAHQVITRRLTVRQAEELAKQKVTPPADADLQAVEQRLTEALGTRVRIVRRRNGSGKIEIDYYSLEQLNGFVDRLSA